MPPLPVPLNRSSWGSKISCSNHLKSKHWLPRLSEPQVLQKKYLKCLLHLPPLVHLFWVLHPHSKNFSVVPPKRQLPMRALCFWVRVVSGKRSLPAIFMRLHHVLPERLLPSIWRLSLTTSSKV